MEYNDFMTLYEAVKKTDVNLGKISIYYKITPEEFCSLDDVFLKTGKNVCILGEIAEKNTPLNYAIFPEPDKKFPDKLFFDKKQGYNPVCLGISAIRSDSNMGPLAKRVLRNNGIEDATVELGFLLGSDRCIRLSGYVPDTAYEHSNGIVCNSLKHLLSRNKNKTIFFTVFTDYVDMNQAIESGIYRTAFYVPIGDKTAKVAQASEWIAKGVLDFLLTKIFEMPEFGWHVQKNRDKSKKVSTP